MRILFSAKLPGSSDQLLRKRQIAQVYDGTAWDVESGMSRREKHCQSKKGEIEHAVKKLIEELKAEGLVS